MDLHVDSLMGSILPWQAICSGFGAWESVQVFNYSYNINVPELWYKMQARKITGAKKVNRELEKKGHFSK